MSKFRQGFTIIELVFVVVLLGTASILFFIQKNNLEVAGRDEQRKTSINAMYYSLEEVFYKANGHYPRVIDEKVLPSVDPELFNDPYDAKIGDADSEFRYEPKNCEADICKGYTLRTVLENEDDFVKESRNS